MNPQRVRAPTQRDTVQQSKTLQPDWSQAKRDTFSHHIDCEPYAWHIHYKHRTSNGLLTLSSINPTTGGGMAHSQPNTTNRDTLSPCMRCEKYAQHTHISI